MDKHAKHYRGRVVWTASGPTRQKSARSQSSFSNFACAIMLLLGLFAIAMVIYGLSLIAVR